MSTGIMTSFPEDLPVLWIRRPHIMAGVEDTNDGWVRLDDQLGTRLFCDGCHEMTDVQMPNERILEAECCECGHTYEVEVD